jgi:tRNA(fMet)-specific endonuclease VapC
MITHVLDTDMVSLYQYGHAAVCAAVDRHPAGSVGITVLTVEEQLSGWYRQLRRIKQPPALAAVYQRMANTVQFYSSLPILSFTEEAIARYEDLKRLKLGIGKTDQRIAAVVLLNQIVLVTRNLRDFQRVPGLQVED